MKAITIKYYANATPLDVMVIVRDDEPFKEAIDLFYKNHPYADIHWVSLHTEKVINGWAQ